MRLIGKLLRTSPVASLFASGLVFLIIIGLRNAGSLESLELGAYDWFIRLQSDVPSAEPHIIIIGISEDDIRNQGRWPLTDATLAKALVILNQYKPRAIGLDIFRDFSVPPGREELDSILARNKHIIAVTKFGEGGVGPPPALRYTDQTGFNDIIVDPGGTVRRGLLFLDDDKTVFYSFALRLALFYLQADGVIPQPDTTNPQHIRLGQTTIRPFDTNDGGYIHADARGYQFLLDFAELKGSFLSFSLTHLLSGGVDPQMIKDKIVVIGAMAQSVKDFFYTPHSRGFQADQQVSGIALQAHITSQLIRFALGESSPIVTTSQNQESLWILLWGILGGAMGLWARSSWRFAMIGSGGLLIIFLSAYFAFLSRWWIPLVPPAMTWLFSAAVANAYMSNQEKKQRAVLMQLFSRHVSKEIAETIWQQRDQFLHGGRPRSQKSIVTVLFSDLKGFTSISENMDPQSLVDWLNTYMESMNTLVMEHGGIIDDYAGDGIKANFGVPLIRTTEEEISRDAANAVDCALAMEKEIYRLNVFWKERGLPTVGVRIGIFTGLAVAGAVGSAQRLKYTTVGDAVNIAARLESYDKDLARQATCRILIGESTLSYLNHQFKTQRVGEARLKGKDHKITIYRVLRKEGKP